MFGEKITGGGNYKSSSTTYSERRCLPSHRCYQFQIMDSFGDGMAQCGNSPNCGTFKTSYNGEVILEGGKEYRDIQVSSFFGDACPSTQPSISLAPSSSTSPSASPSISPAPTPQYIYDYRARQAFTYFLIFGLSTILCCCFFATRTRNANTTRRVEEIQRQNATEEERRERYEFIMRNIVIERKKKTSSLDGDDAASLDFDSKVGANSKSGSNDSPKGSIRSFSNQMLKGLGISSFHNDDVCAICLDDRESDICSSKNKMCPHKFHLDCMVSWLMAHDNCPICRLPYLTNEEE